VLSRYLTHPALQASIYALLTEGVLVFFVAAVCLWCIALRPGEREKFSAAFLKVFNRGTPA
jgi:hypothetical protein